LKKQDNGIRCSEHCICLEVPYEKEKCVEFDKNLEQIITKLNRKLAKLRFQLLWSGFLRRRRKKGKYRYGISLNTIRGRKNVALYYQVFTLLNEIEKLPRIFNWSPETGMSCTTLAFSKKYYKLVGELELPTKLPLRPALIEKIGEPELSGVVITMKGSPSGLIRAEIHDEGRTYFSIRVTHEFKPPKTKNIFSLTFDKSKELSKFFVVRKL